LRLEVENVNGDELDVARLTFAIIITVGRVSAVRFNL